MSFFPLSRKSCSANIEDMPKYLFDGEIEREWPEGGLLLDALPDRVRRAVIRQWMEYLLPSAVGDPRFEYITQNRSLAEKNRNSYFSTCGELAMTALYVIGYRGKCLNRTLKATDGGPRKYIPGRNMSALMGHLGGPSKQEGAWVPWEGSTGRLPLGGDILCVTEGPPRSEHVMVSLDLINIDGDEDYDAIYVAEAGRGYIKDQHGGFATKDMIGKRLGGKTCVGFIDIGKLRLTAPAVLPPV